MLIVGNGTWGNKVTLALRNSQKIVTSQIGAREFLALAGKNSSLIDVDVIWICTTPAFQIKLLKLLQPTGFLGLLLIEKPFASDKGEYNTLLESKIALPGLSISNPWTYSEMWRNFKNEFEQKGHEYQIEGIRQGPVQRDYISPQQDWLFHDLMLSLDLAKHISTETDLIVVVDFVDIEKQGISVRISPEVKIKISGGFALERVAKWTVLYENVTATLNFQTNEFSSLRGESEGLCHDLVSYSDHPLSTMLYSLINQYQNEAEFVYSLEILSSLK